MAKPGASRVMANEPFIYHLLAAGGIASIKHTLWIIVVIQVLRSGISQGDKIKVYMIKSDQERRLISVKLPLSASFSSS